MDDRTDAQQDLSLIPQPSSLPSHRFRPYPSYKYSGVEWLGEIPAYWKILPFKRLFSVIYRYPTYYGIEYVPEGVPEIRGEAISENGDIIELDDQRYITAELSQQYPHTILTVGDLVMSVRGTMGKVGLVDKRYENANITANLLRLSPRSQIALGKFLVFAFSSLYFRQQLDRQSPQTTIKTITVPQLSSIPVVIPPKEDQTRIVEFIVNETSKIDALVAKKERLIELLQEQRTALITHAVTKGLDPDVPMRDSSVEWLGEIPSHWKVKKLKRLCLVRRGASPRPIDDPIYFDEDGEYSWVRIADVTASDRYLRQTTQRLSELGKLKSVPLEPGELFLSIAATVGKPIITKIKCCIHDGFVYFVGLRENREYLYYLFTCGAPYKGLGKLGTQLNLNTDTIGDIYIPVPPAKEQSTLVQHLDDEIVKIDQLVSKIREGIERLKEFRTALISAAVTGKIDVREEVA